MKPSDLNGEPKTGMTTGKFRSVTNKQTGLISVIVPLLTILAYAIAEWLSRH